MRELTIKVRISEDQNGCRIMTDRKTGDGEYTVVLSPNQRAKEKIQPMVALAHELGHVLGYEFGLPAHEELTKYSSDFLAGNSSAGIAVYTSGTILNQEHEAWNLAEEMFKTREWAIATYERETKLRQEIFKVKT